jgi:hypothetical protein
MEKTAQTTNPSTPRDYDKDPIVIEDYNPLFMWWQSIYVVLPLGIIVLLSNPFHKDITNMILKLFITMPIILFPIYKQYRFAKGHRKIILKENEINYYHDEYKITQMNLNSIKSIHKTFDDFYHSSQQFNWFYSFLVLIFFPFVILIKVALITIKGLKHLLLGNRLSEFVLYDAIIIESQAGDILNILPQNNSERKQIKIYFLSKINMDIDQLPNRYSIFYSFEKINIGEK